MPDLIAQPRHVKPGQVGPDQPVRLHGPAPATRGRRPLLDQQHAVSGLAEPVCDDDPTCATTDNHIIKRRSSRHRHPDGPSSTPATRAITRNSLIRQRRPLRIGRASSRRIELRHPYILRIVLQQRNLRRTGRVPRRSDGLRPAEHQLSGAGARGPRHAVVVPRETVLAAEEQGVVRGVDGRRDLREGRVAGVHVWHDVARAEAEGGQDGVFVRPRHEQEVAGHASLEGDAAPACSCGVGGGALLSCQLSRTMTMGRRPYQVSDELGRVRSQGRAGQRHAESETARRLARGHGPRIKLDACAGVGVDHRGA
jgi:hypothetical protein